MTIIITQPGHASSHIVAKAGLPLTDTPAGGWQNSSSPLQLVHFHAGTSETLLVRHVDYSVWDEGGRGKECNRNNPSMVTQHVGLQADTNVGRHKYCKKIGVLYVNAR